jgi:fucose permease
VAASLVSAIGGMPFNVLPQIINSVGSSFQWGPEQLGLFGSSYLGGYFIATLTAPLWIERLQWRRLSWAAVLASCTLLYIIDFIILS